MKRELSAILKKGSISGIEAGKIILRTNIDNLNGIGDPKHKQLFTNAELMQIYKAVPSSVEEQNNYETYQCVSRALIAVHNYNKTLIQEAQNSKNGILLQLEKFKKDFQIAECVSSFPLPLTQPELDACKRKSRAEVRKQKISLGEVWLNEIQTQVGRYLGRGSADMIPEVDKALDTIVTDSYLCSLPCNQDLITEGGIRFSELNQNEKAEALLQEAIDNLLKHFDMKSDAELPKTIYNRAQIVFRELFDDSENFIQSIKADAPEGISITGILDGIGFSFWMCFVATRFNELLNKNPLEIINVYLTSILLKASKKREKESLFTQRKVFEKIFGFAPLNYRPIPRKDGVTVRHILQDAYKRTGGTQEGFCALLPYLEGLKPIFECTDEGKEMLEAIQDPEAVESAFKTMQQIGKLADDGSSYCDYLVGESASKEKIIARFKKDYPKDNRSIYAGDKYQVYDTLWTSIIDAYQMANMRELKERVLDPQLCEKSRNLTKISLTKTCKRLLLGKRIFEILADIYKTPELATAKLEVWDGMSRVLDGLNLAMLRLFPHEGSRYNLSEKESKALLDSFYPLSMETVQPDEEALAPFLEAIKQDPFSDKARFILENIFGIYDEVVPL